MIKKRNEKKRIRKGKRDVKIIEKDGKIEVVMKNGNGKDAKKKKNAK